MSALREGPAAVNRRRRKQTAATPASCARSEARAARYHFALASRRRAALSAARSAARTWSGQPWGSVRDRRRFPPGLAPSGPKRARASASAPPASARTRLRRRALVRLPGGWSAPTRALSSASDGPPWVPLRGLPGGPQSPAALEPPPPARAWVQQHQPPSFRRWLPPAWRHL